MSETRTIEWASIAGWVSENEQQIRDVMKFEGLKGAMVEVLRLAPDQPELAALREELARVQKISDNYYALLVDANQRLADAERRNSVLIAAAEKSLQVFRSMLRDKSCGVHYAAAQAACHQINAAIKPNESEATEQEYIGLNVCVSCSGRFGELKTCSNSLLSKAYYVKCASCGAKTSGYDKAASAVKEWNGEVPQ